MVTILFVAFFFMLLIGVPIVVSLGIASVLAVVIGSEWPLLLLPQKIFNGINSFPFMAIPLFLLAGNIMAEAKISDRLVGLASMLVGRYPGGLAQVHERGGEIIDLPRGSRVYPHDESVRMARQEGAAKSGGSGGVTIHIANMAVREEADIEKVGDAIFRKIKKASTNRGSWTYAGSMV